MSSLYHFLAAILAFYYDNITANYAVAIAFLTLTVMIPLAPLTVKGTRSMIAMQSLQPEMKKLQQKYKGDRQQMNEELMKLYKENKINPTSGCLPMLIQLPVFFVLYRVIANITHKTTYKTATYCPSLHQTVKAGVPCPSPQNIGQNTKMYHDLIQSGGHMHAFGIDLSLSATSVHSGIAVVYWVLVVGVAAMQYVQTKQLNGRNPAAAANPQAKMMQRIMPVFFLFISVSIAAALNVYFLVSSGFRILQTELMYRFDPILSAHAARQQAAVIDAPSRPSQGGAGWRDTLKGMLNPAGTGGGGDGGTRRPSSPPPKGRPSTQGRSSGATSSAGKNRPAGGQAQGGGFLGRLLGTGGGQQERKPQSGPVGRPGSGRTAAGPGAKPAGTPPKSSGQGAKRPGADGNGATGGASQSRNNNRSRNKRGRRSR